MDFEEKREQALALLAEKGILRTVYEPFAVKLLWKMGVQVPPPHFMSFWRMASLSAFWFTAAWGLWMWIFAWSGQGKPVATAVITACAAGLFFGLAMATFYLRDKKKHDLPDWESLGEVA
jgi:hypothetical protein